MNGGLIAFIGGLVAIIVAFLCGKSQGVTKGKAQANESVSKARSETAEAQYEAQTAQKDAQMRKDVTPIIADLAASNSKAQAEYEATQREIQSAKRNNDLDALGRIAGTLAQKALEMGASKKEDNE